MWWVVGGLMEIKGLQWGVRGQTYTQAPAKLRVHVCDNVFWLISLSFFLLISKRGGGGRGQWWGNRTGGGSTHTGSEPVHNKMDIPMLLGLKAF